jgi:hypothetical protein
VYLEQRGGRGGSHRQQQSVVGWLWWKKMRRSGGNAWRLSRQGLMREGRELGSGNIAVGMGGDSLPFIGLGVVEGDRLREENGGRRGGVLTARVQCVS